MSEMLNQMRSDERLEEEAWIECGSSTLCVQIPLTVNDAFLSMLRHPIENLLRQRHWKSAVLSALMRGALFFFTNLSVGVGAALGAMSIELAFYIAVAGFYGAVT